MVNDWPERSLDSLCTLITDGKHGDCVNLPNSGFFFLSVKDVVGGRLQYDGARQICERDFLETHRRTNLEPGDVLFTNTGTIGRMAIAPDDPKTYRTTFQKSVAILKPRHALISSRFLYYSLRAANSGLSSLAAGTTQVNLLLKDIKRFRIKVPSLNEQSSAVRVLTALDDKIELNRRNNDALQELARKVFNDWFVEFGPVRAKIAGGAQYLPSDLWSLFPDRLGVDGIPVGWREQPLSAFFSIIGGGTPKTSVAAYWDGNIPWFSVVDTPRDADVFVIDTAKTVTRLGLEESSARVVPARTTIISARGTVGNLAMAGREIAFNQSCYGLRGLDDAGDCFVFLAAQHMVAGLQAMAHGSVFSTITRQTFDVLFLARATAKILERFEASISPLFDKVLTNVGESRTLAQTRDLLLPRLMSGELHLRDAEKVIEAAS